LGLVVGEDVEYVLNILPVALPKGRMGLVFWALLLKITKFNRYIYVFISSQVAIKPESVSRARNRWIINELVSLHKQHLDGRLPVYDGRKSLFTAGPLPFKSKEFVLNLTNPERASQGCV